MHTICFCVLASFIISASCSLNQDLTQVILNKEGIVRSIAEQVKIAYRNRCSYQCTCSYAACVSDTSAIQTCDSDRGNVDVCVSSGPTNPECTRKRLVSFTNSSYRVAGWDGKPSTLSSALNDTICWTAALDPIFVQYNDPSITWQYFASPLGLLRGYPGNSRKDCGTYDPRNRPWYVSAATGPKNVIIVLDKSGSMDQENRMVAAKQAINTVLDTLGFGDYFGVVAFNETAEVLGGFTSLKKATLANVAAMKALVNSVTPLGQTNMTAGFAQAFALEETSRTANELLCKTVILFLTDGKKNEQNQTALLEYLRAANTQNIPIFTYSFLSADPADDILPQAIACQNSGVWAKIYGSFAAYTATQMSQYYNYFAKSRASNEVVWVEPYLDTSGAGNLTAASITVFDDTQNPPVFIGVVSLAFQLSSFQIPNFQSFLDILVIRGQACATLNFTECDLESLRTSTRDPYAFGGGGVTKNCSNILSTGVCPPNEVVSTCGRNPAVCNYQSPTSYNYTQQSCCTSCTGMLLPPTTTSTTISLTTGSSTGDNNNNNGVSGSTIGIAIAIPVAVIVIIAIIVFVVKNNAGKQAGPRVKSGSQAPQQQGGGHADIDDKSW